MKVFFQKLTNFLTKSIIILAGVIFVLAITGMVYQTATAESDQRKYPPPGVLDNVDGYKMHIHCTGEGSPHDRSRSRGQRLICGVFVLW